MPPEALDRPAPTEVLAKPRGHRRPTMTGEEMLLCARLHRQGRNATAISRLLSTDQRVLTPETVAEWLRRAKQPAEDLHMALASLRLDAVEAWSLAMKRGARDGRHAPAKDLLIATGTVDKDQGHGLTIVIGNGVAHVETLPALPQRPTLAVLDAQPEHHAPQLPARSEP